MNVAKSKMFKMNNERSEEFARADDDVGGYKFKVSKTKRKD